MFGSGMSRRARNGCGSRSRRRGSWPTAPMAIASPWEAAGWARPLQRPPSGSTTPGRDGNSCNWHGKTKPTIPGTRASSRGSPSAPTVRSLAAAARDGRLRVWDLTAVEPGGHRPPARVLEERRIPLSDVAWSADGGSVLHLRHRRDDPDVGTCGSRGSPGAARSVLRIFPTVLLRGRL